MRAFIHATIYPVSGPKLEDATLLIQNGTIVAVGQHIDIPTGADIVD